MTQAIGSAAYLAYVKESTFGVTPTTPQLKYLSQGTYGENLTSEATELISNAISPQRGVQDTRNGLVSVSGSIPFELSLDNMKDVFELLMGNVVTTGTGPSYTHTFKRGVNRKSFTLEKGFTDINQFFVYKGCVINSMQLNLEPGSLSTGSLEIIGKDLTATGTPLDATITNVAHKAFANFEAAALENAVTANLLNANFTISNNAYANNIVGSRFAKSVNWGKATVEGEIVVEFEDLTMFNKWLNETETSLKFTYVNGTKSIEFHFPKVKFNGSASPAISTDQGIVLTLGFRALLDTVQGSDVVITLVNEEA